ncbi:MAG: Smr/MutS family protein [Thermoanaerobaculales bacterium]|nr:Smr/MutS family protein [Thermoanaerobaculales bacterium]
MWREILADPKVRRAYILTKVGVFLAAAVATIPLAHFVGPKAWIGLGVFGLLLMGLTACVLAVGKVEASTAAEVGSEHQGNDGFEGPEVVVHPVEDFIDLHSFPPRDIPSVVESYLETALEQGYREVRLIHGRGIGVQRERVRSTLARHPAVMSFDDAPPEHGGWGATVVILRRP